jgi:flagellar motility protein MotE (MotC chaperone)
MAIPKAYSTAGHKFKDSLTENRKPSFFLKNQYAFLGLCLLIVGLIGLRIFMAINNPQSGKGFIDGHMIKKMLHLQFSFGGGKVMAEENKEPNKSEAAQPEEFDPLTIGSAEEVRVLKSLADRRAQLEELERKQREKEMALQALDKELQSRLTQIEQIKQEVDITLKKIDTQEKQELKGLVKIYEGMKPKDAAKILNQIDLNTLRDIVELMNQRKASEILGSMDEGRVKDLTLSMAGQKSPLASPEKQNP